MSRFREDDDVTGGSQTYSINKGYSNGSRGSSRQSQIVPRAGYIPRLSKSRFFRIPPRLAVSAGRDDSPEVLLRNGDGEGELSSRSFLRFSSSLGSEVKLEMAEIRCVSSRIEVMEKKGELSWLLRSSWSQSDAPALGLAVKGGEGAEAGAWIGPLIITIVEGSVERIGDDGLVMGSPSVSTIVEMALRWEDSRKHVMRANITFGASIAD